VSQTFDIQKWFGNHTPEHTLPSLNKVIAWLEQQGVKHFAAVGFCFGGMFLLV
jgi:dienelactone hydrolase